jgi:hypothetical protein
MICEGGLPSLLTAFSSHRPSLIEDAGFSLILSLEFDSHVGQEVLRGGPFLFNVKDDFGKEVFKPLVNRLLVTEGDVADSIVGTGTADMER